MSILVFPPLSLSYCLRGTPICLSHAKPIVLDIMYLWGPWGLVQRFKGSKAIAMVTNPFINKGKGNKANSDPVESESCRRIRFTGVARIWIHITRYSTYLLVKYSCSAV